MSARVGDWVGERGGSVSDWVGGCRDDGRGAGG